MSTSFCAINWKEHGHHIRVYSSTNSNVIERGYDSDQWFTGGYRGTGETVAATACIGDDNIEHVRVYTISGTDITEQIWNGDERIWKPGAFSSSGNAVAATSWVSANGERHYRVYVVGFDHKLTEYWWNDGQWSIGELSLEGVTRVAVTTFTTTTRPPSGPTRGQGGPKGSGGGFDQATKYIADHLLGGGMHLGIRLYVRQTDGKIVEYCNDADGWFDGGFPPVWGVDCAATSYVKRDGSKDRYSLRVYVVDGNAILGEYSFDGTFWAVGDFVIGGVDSVSATAWTSGTNVPLVGDGDDSTHLRVYAKGSGTITEHYWDGSWATGKFTLA